MKLVVPLPESFQKICIKNPRSCKTETTFEDYAKTMANLILQKFFSLLSHWIITLKKDVRELSCMSHRVIRFWFILNFLFISAFFDILASLSISRVFSSDISGRWKSSGTNYKYFSCKSSCLLLLLEVFKNHYRKENISVGGSKQQRDTLFWIHLRETWLQLFRLL